jgi:hypothetical protein
MSDLAVARLVHDLLAAISPDSRIVHAGFLDLLVDRLGEVSTAAAKGGPRADAALPRRRRSRESGDELLQDLAEALGLFELRTVSDRSE